MNSQISRDIGKNLITVGLAVAAAQATIISQIATIQTEHEQFKTHIENGHPPRDYRELINEKIQGNKENLIKHEYNHER